ncbi:MAG: hypothetical protein O3C21_05770 [Verrucomicrobia bacterium]|nr:hypothetical protein [Verrucomicrobiota bacterium]
MQPPSDNQAEEPALPPYADPRESRLEPFAERITQMRAKRYPYRTIAEDLSGRGMPSVGKGSASFALPERFTRGSALR